MIIMLSYSNDMIISKFQAYWFQYHGPSLRFKTKTTVSFVENQINSWFIFIDEVHECVRMRRSLVNYFSVQICSNYYKNTFNSMIESLTIIFNILDYERITIFHSNLSVYFVTFYWNLNLDSAFFIVLFKFYQFFYHVII